MTGEESGAWGCVDNGDLIVIDRSTNKSRCRSRIRISAGNGITTGSEYVIPVSGCLKLVIPTNDHTRCVKYANVSPFNSRRKACGNSK